ALFEERIDGSGAPRPAFGNAEDIVSTEKMLENLLENSNHKVDQKAYIKARLFDMLIGDWDRHDDQWRWAKFKEGDKVIYKPIPRDRDQAYTKIDGFITRIIGSAERLEGVENFRYRVKNVKKFNGPAVFLDRKLTNEAPRQLWIDAATELQQSITDAVIEKAIHQLPPEVFPKSGERIIRRLKSRRGYLVQDAAKYYKFLNKEVDVPGTTKAELFQVNRISDQETNVSIYDLNKSGTSKSEPFYNRTFHADETKEIRLYGLSGKDQYRIEGSNTGIRIRMIGGTDVDSFITPNYRRTIIYDNPNNNITEAPNTRKEITFDTLVNAFRYRGYRPNMGSTIKSGGINVEKGLYISTGYKYERHKWRQEPFAWRQAFRIDYSLTQMKLGVGYHGLFNNTIGNWDLAINAEYYPTYTINFAGVGNETEINNKKSLAKYYHFPRRNGFANIGLNRQFGTHHTFGFSLFYQGLKFIQDKDHFIPQNYPINDGFYKQKQYGGIQTNYLLSYINDVVLPTKGIQWASSIAFTQNLKESSRNFMRYATAVGFYVPMGRTLSLAVKASGTTVTGEPEFFQLSWLGAADNLRGFRKYRFWGKTAFYENAELRWVVPTRNYFFTGKIGLLALLDNGRVWQPGEKSNTWHTGYGGGLLIAPFNRIAIIGTYAVSKEDKRINVRLARFF
ncbi:MAG: hypothetical protein ICV79_22095, partial [Flavisolibacter sp.]|nr:hypothetical protein [Flavisolibacter sp.]